MTHPVAPDEAALLAALRAGDEHAFELLVRAFGGRLLAVARRLVRDEEDARDVVQTAYLNAFRSLPDFAGGSQLATWLHRIVVNVALMKLRTRRRKPEQSIEALLPAFLDDGHHVEQYADWAAPADVTSGSGSARSRTRTRPFRRTCPKSSCAASSRRARGSDRLYSVGSHWRPR